VASGSKYVVFNSKNLEEACSSRFERVRKIYKIALEKIKGNVHS